MRILILSSSAGNGHNSAGNKIKEKFLQEDSNNVIGFIDAYKEFGSKLGAWIIEDGYFLACNHFVTLYNYFFEKNEHESYEKKHKFSCPNPRNLCGMDC